MKHEFHAQFSLALHDSLTQGFAIAWLVKQSTRLPAQWPEITQLKNDWARLEILSQAIITGRKEEARMGTRRMSGGLRYWIERHANIFLHNQVKLMENIRLTSTLSDLSIFPPSSWTIQISFTLRKPYISRDDTDFYIVDNPVKKEWVFKVPYVAPSQWKGALRAAMTRDLAAWWQSLPSQAKQKRETRKQFVQRRLQITRLFGNEKGVSVNDSQFEAYLDRVAEDKHLNRWYRRALRCLCAPTGFLAGRLHFYPTFFDKIGLEVINPHDRKTGTGKQPIYFECVPQGTKGTFTLLYVPMREVDEDTSKEDLIEVVKGIKAMLTRYGFGAKTSSGYGVADVEEYDIKVQPKIWLEDFLKAWRSYHTKARGTQG